MAKCCLTSGAASIKTLKSVGRPPSESDLTQAEIEYMVNKHTLVFQNGMNLYQRASQLSLLLGKPIKPWELRGLYYARRIKLKVPKKRLGRPNLPPAQEQQELIDYTRDQVAMLISQGYEIIQIDASLFSNKSLNKETWAGVGDRP
jgi:hypothetical protein